MADDSRINVYTLGEGGVDVDTDPILTADNATLQSQNANYDPTSARGGALSKRRGLDRFHTTVLGGPILGGIEAPFQGFAGAPAAGGGGGGAPGDPGGTGGPSGGTGSGPGDPIGGPPGSTGSGPVLDPGGPLFGGKRLVAVGRWADGDLGTLTASWYLSSIGFADKAVLITPTSAPSVGAPSAEGPNASFPTTVGNMSIGQKYTTANGVLYYQQHIANQLPAVSPVLPIIRKMTVDGKRDSAIFTLPDNPIVLKTYSAGTTIVAHLVSVTAMVTEWGNGDAMWIAVYDKITNGSIPGSYGRVLRVTGLDSGSFVVTEVYNSLNTNNVSNLNNTPAVPYCLENFLGKMWMGMWTGVSGGSPCYAMFQPDPASPDGYRFVKVTASSDTSVTNVTCMKAYNGNLYIGYTNSDPAVAHAFIYQRTPDDVNSASVQGSGGSAVSELGWVSMELFQGKLYASYFNFTQTSKIYSFDGTTWTAVYTSSSTAQKRMPLVLRADGATLYAWGANDSDNTTTWLSSTDGVNWTDQSSNLNFDGASKPTNLLFGFEQT